MKITLPIGSHLATPRTGFVHHGIYVGKGRVVHYTGNSLFKKNGVIKQVSLRDFCAGRRFSVVEHDAPKHDGTVIALRAMQRINEQNYYLWTNNCEHFCTWCILDTGSSKQVEEAPKRAAVLGGASSGLMHAMPRLLILTSSLTAIAAIAIAAVAIGLAPPLRNEMDFPHRPEDVDISR